MRATVVLDLLSCCISISTNVERGLFVGVRVHMSLDRISNSFGFLLFCVSVFSPLFNVFVVI